MYLLDINIQYRVIIGISAMVVLFSCFLVIFITSQRKKLQYHRDLQLLHEKQKALLTEQNLALENKVQERTAELVLQKDNLQLSLAELKLAQAQLVQREKMASLGELTAGIAHEIQNPLNFVNNFSEINVELLAEMKEQLAREQLSASAKDGVESLSRDLTQNLEKVIQHGKRADAIVKSMLLHSQTGTAVRERVDLNELVDQYLRIAYHGQRGKDKSFQVNIKTDFDAAISQMQLIPQDMGRVLLNLFANAFYAVHEKLTRTPDFQGVVSVTTHKKNNYAEIIIEDNGTGIPSTALNKIFQPFFTTKPSGQGTGLGLSMAYDIVHAYGGTLTVETQEKEFTRFTIQLPLLNSGPVFEAVR